MRHMKLTSLIILSLLILLAACNQQTNQVSQNLLLIFADQEEDVEPYTTRILITPDYMRFDDGEGAVDYLIFDRKQKTIYNMVQESQSITVITALPSDVKPPIKLNLSHKMVDDLQDAPTMQGVKPQHHIYMADRQICFEVVSVPGFLPAYVKAMKEFNTVLANDSTVTMNNLPADMQNACSLAKNTFAPNRHFQAGFPLQQWGPDGKRSALLDFKTDYPIDKTLFEIPVDYQRVNIQDIRASFSKQ